MLGFFFPPLVCRDTQACPRVPAHQTHVLHPFRSQDLTWHFNQIIKQGDLDVRRLPLKCPIRWFQKQHLFSLPESVCSGSYYKERGKFSIHVMRYHLHGQVQRLGEKWIWVTEKRKIRTADLLCQVKDVCFNQDFITKEICVTGPSLPLQEFMPRLLPISLPPP